MKKFFKKKLRKSVSSEAEASGKSADHNRPTLGMESSSDEPSGEGSSHSSKLLSPGIVRRKSSTETRKGTDSTASVFANKTVVSSSKSNGGTTLYSNRLMPDIDVRIKKKASSRYYEVSIVYVASFMMLGHYCLTVFT